MIACRAVNASNEDNRLQVDIRQNSGEEQVLSKDYAVLLVKVQWQLVSVEGQSKGLNGHGRSTLMVLAAAKV